MIQSALFELPEMELPLRHGPATVSAMSSHHVLTKGRGSTKDFDFTLNAYRGCGFGCSYCFAAAFVADDAQRANWGHWIEVKTRAIEEVRSRALFGKTIFMSSSTDPYQPLERRLGLTRGIVEELARVQARLVVQTRSPLCTRDIDLFARMKHVRVNMSITTDDDEIRKRFEPSCASIGRRLEAVRELAAAGIRTSICICPMLPISDPVGFAKTIRGIGPTHVAAGFFHDSDVPFVSTTRDPAKQLAYEMEWNRAAYDRVKEILWQELGLARDEGFGPV